MKKHIVCGTLTVLLAAGLCVPAQAFSAAPAAAIWMSTQAAMQVMRGQVLRSAKPGTEGSALEFASVESVVRTGNENIKSFDKTLSSVKNTDIDSQFWNQSFSLSGQIAQYQKQINDLQSSINKLSEDMGNNAALVQTLRTQQAALKASLAAAQNSYQDLDDAEEDAEEELGFTITSTERQLGNAADQIVMGAETAYISIHTLNNTVDGLQQNLAALDRGIAIVKTQISLGAATQLDLLSLETQRQSLDAQIQTLETQRRSLKNNLSVLCGYGTGQTVEVGDLPDVTEAQLAAMDYEKDLAAALQNSYSIWAKEDAVRQASRDYENDKTTTLHAYDAAKIDLAAEKESVMNKFRQQFKAVQDKQTLYAAAQSAYTQAQKTFAVKELQYQRGAISKNEYQNEKDTLDSAYQSMRTAQIERFTAYNTYRWAKRGVMN